MIALYSRVSTQEQAVNGHSIDEQKERLENYCKAMGWSAFTHYTDAGFSGGNIKRPALQRLINDSASLEKVIVYKLDRLSRSQKDTLYLIEDVFLKNGVDFISVSENFDTSSPFGKAMIGILAVFAQLEREQIKERMTMGRTARTKAGDFHGSGHIPIGYDYVDGKLIVNEYEKVLVQKVFESAASGKGIRTIVKEMNANGLTHKNGMWNAQTVRNMLQRRTYIGEVSFGGIWYHGNHEPLISEELFKHVQFLNNTRKQKALQYNERIGKAKHLLSGLVFCAQCGARYTKQVYTHKVGEKTYRYDKYSCASRNKRAPELVIDPNCKNKSISSQYLEDIIIQQLKLLKIEPLTAQHPPDTSSIENELKSIEQQTNRMMDLYSMDGIPLDALRIKIDALTKRKTSLIKALNEIRQRSNMAQEATVLINNIGDVFEHGTFEQKRALLSALINRIEINGDDIKIVWNFTP